MTELGDIRTRYSAEVSVCNRSVEALQLGREPIAVLGLMLVPVNKSLAGAPYHGMLRV